jgi:hypothetical protein
MNPPVDELPSWLDLIDPDAMRGLELGALDKPRFDRTRTDVRYVDHASTEDLRQKYATDDVMADHLDDIVDVDFVWAGPARLAEVVGEAAPFDFAYASHVAEHAPDLIGWLDQVAEVLVDGGILALALPDKRLCFDVNRSVTEMSDLIDAHLRGLTAPGYRQIYDFNSKIVAVDPGLMWAGQADYTGQWRTDLDPDQWGYELCLKHQQTGEYIDGHCSVFTPASFLDLYSRLVALDLIDYRIASFHPTEINTIEFRVCLQKLPSSLTGDERRAAQLASVPSAADIVPSPAAAGPEAVASVGDDAVVMVVSTREQAWLQAKRRSLETARQAASKARSRVRGLRS